MKRLTLIATVFLFLLSCKSSTKNAKSEKQKQVIPKTISDNQDTILSHKPPSDTNNVHAFGNPEEKNQNTQQEKIPFFRQDEFISDTSLKGSPIKNQINLSKKMFKKFPDTLSNLAINNYKSYTNHFPRAIADNFKEGTSRVIIFYPEKLKFRFELFENEYSETPYITKEVTIRRSENGELYAE